MLRAGAVVGLLLLLLHEGVEGCNNVSALSEQLDRILAEYDRDIAPAQPVRVHVVFDLRHAALHPDDTVHMLADLTLSWQDPRISWNATEWDCANVLASPDRLWLPSVELLNGAGGGRAALSVRVASDGRLVWVQRLDAAVPIELALQDWPVDVQTAVFKFGSRTHFKDELELEISDVMLAVVFEAGEWELVSLKGGLLSLGERSVAAWMVRLRRRAAAHEAAAGAVLASAVLMLLAAAALPATTRVPLCACASFTATLWLVSALMRVPGGPSTPRSLSVMCAVCVSAAGAAAAAALVARLTARADQPPAPLRTLASTLSRWCKLASTEESRAQAQVGAWAVLGAALDRALTCALLLALFICVCVYM